MKLDLKEDSKLDIYSTKKRIFKFNFENINDERFVSNFIVTSKYNVIDFLPKILFI